MPVDLEIWQHRTSGERYAVLAANNENGGSEGITAAVGPLHHRDVDRIIEEGWIDNSDLAVVEDLAENPAQYRVVYPYQGA